jgi:hypothetical protein
MLALLLVVGLSSPTTLTSGPGAERPTAPILDEVEQPARLAQAQTVDPTAPDHTPTFLEQYMSLTISPVASREVQDGLIVSHVIGYCGFGLCGGLWGPIVAVKGAQFTGDVVISWFLSNIIWSVGSTLTGGLLGFVWPYLATTATLNAIDRDIKKRGVATTPGVAPTTPAPPPPAGQPPPPADTPPPSYAY